MGHEDVNGHIGLPDADKIRFLGPYERFCFYVASGLIDTETAYKFYQQAISSFKFDEAANIAGDIFERRNNKVLAGLLKSNSYDWEGLERYALSFATQNGNGHHHWI